MSNKKQKLKKIKPFLQIPEKFKDFEDCVDWTKKSTYMIAR
jgi:hypothetical protein